MTDLTDRAHEITVRRAAREAAERLAIKSTDLTIAAAILDVHGAPHLKPISDRLAGLAASLAAAEPESTPEPTPSVTEPQEAPREH